MNATVTKKRPWRRDRPIPNPYHDSLRQEIGYKVDARYAGCVLTILAAGMLILFGFAFVVYWLMH